MEQVYREAFGRTASSRASRTFTRAVHATWQEVHLARERGEERWGAPGGEAGFWRRFVGSVFGRVGGGAMPEPLLAELVTHFGAEAHWAVYPETRPSSPRSGRRV